MRTQEINGVVFEIIRPRDLVKAHQDFLDLYLASPKSLQECYERPSHMKELIYNQWHNWFYSDITRKCFEDVVWLGVKSYNGFTFTLQGCVCMNGIDYIMEITPSHNRLIQASC